MKTGDKGMAGFLLFCGIMFLSCVAAAGQSNIRSVDFRNFTYAPFCAGDKPHKISVTNGEFSSEKQMDGYVDRFYFKVQDVEFGDLNGDRKNETVVLSICNTGGTGNFSEGFIYTIKGGKPMLVARISGGDRAYGGLRTAKIENRVLIVESNDVGESGGACCPEYVITTRYRLARNRIAAIGRPVRRELFPKTRITFARGSSEKSLNIMIPDDEGKRFVVGARAGQVLRVSTNSDKVSLRLLDDAIVTEGLNSFTARLPTTGDYTFEIQNNGESDVAIKLNIKIQ